MKTGVGAKTNKPVMFKTDKNILQTSDVNNERKFVFISQENTVDYREKNDINNDLNRINGDSNGFHKICDQFIERCPETPPKKKFPWVKDRQIKRSQTINVCDVVTLQHLPTATFVTLEDDHSEQQHSSPPPPLNDNNNSIHLNNRIISNNNNINNENTIGIKNETERKVSLPKERKLSLPTERKGSIPTERKVIEKQIDLSPPPTTESDV